jgi:phage tail sheath protein FI
MALLKGFPPSNTISPSVRIAERDLSFYGNTTPSTNMGAFVGFASKGPINLPALVQSQSQLNTIFGFPHPDESDPYLIYAVQQFLRTSSACYVVRVADTNITSDTAALTASVDLTAAGEVVDIYSLQPGDYTLTKDTFFRWKLNGVLASKVLVALAGTYTTTELVEMLNEQLIPTVDGIEFYVHVDGLDETIGLKSVWAYGSSSIIELVSVADSLYGPASEVGLGTGMLPATSNGDNVKYPTSDPYQTSGNFDFTGLTDQYIEVVVTGTDNGNIDDVVQTIPLTALEGSNQTITDIITEINNQIALLPGGFQAVAHLTNQLGFETLASGRDSKILIKTTSFPAASIIFGFDGTTGIGTSPAGVTGDLNIDTLARVSGTSVTSDVSMTITADSAGIEGNKTTVLIENDLETGNFNMRVFNQSVQVEAWGQLSKVPGSRYYVESYLQLVSDYVRAIDNTLVAAPPINNGPLGSALSGGTDGVPADPDAQDDLLIGSRTAYTGLYTLSEPEQIDIDLVMVPGHSSTRVMQALIQMVQDRGDCLAIIDPPFGLTVREIIQWSNGVHPLNTYPLNTDFAALYWPWLNITDIDNGIDVWVPPSGTVAGAYARNDQIAGPWYAPAGLDRGLLTSVNDVYNRPTLAERDSMYGNGNAINPIVSFADSFGFVIFGQKTLQRRPTALDRVNVRRMLFYIEKRIKSASRTLLFEPNDDRTRNKFIGLSKDILDFVVINRGITEYNIQCDAVINTADVIDRNELRAKIGVIPTKSVEFIFIEFTILRTNALS